MEKFIEEHPGYKALVKKEMVGYETETCVFISICVQNKLVPVFADALWYISYEMLYLVGSYC